MKITLKDYAVKNGITPSAVRHKILRGNLNAVKMGRDWLIEDDELYTDKRVITGKYKKVKEANHEI